MHSPKQIFVGFDQREAVAFHTFTQSIIENSSIPISIIPLSLRHLNDIYLESHSDGSNDFIYSRFLVPYLTQFKGVALFCDGDMILNADIKQLFDLADNTKAVQVVKHQYKTKLAIKYLGNKNEDYPRKNWSSVILWNCNHPSHRILTPDFVAKQSGAFLHRFQWLKDSEIGELDTTWNWLAEEYPLKPDSKLVHYTLGTPCFSAFRNCAQSEIWHQYRSKSQEGMEK